MRLYQGETDRDRQTETDRQRGREEQNQAMYKDKSGLLRVWNKRKKKTQEEKKGRKKKRTKRLAMIIKTKCPLHYDNSDMFSFHIFSELTSKKHIINVN